MKKNQVGFTILEIILVVAIAGLIIVIAFRQYQSYRYHAHVSQIQTNLDNLFQAMFLYYKANCAKGSLAPKDPFTDPYIIDIEKDLKDKKYLNEDLIPSPLVDADETNAEGYKGYFAQFNLALKEREVCVSADCKEDEKKTMGKIVIWIPQISIRLKDPEIANAYKNLLEAECLSYRSGYCTEPDKKHIFDYLVFERTPVNTNVRARSNYWGTTPTVSQFKQMYSTNPIGSLLNGNQTASQYFVCGG